MATKTVFGQPHVGRIWLPQINVSYPGAGRVKPRHQGVVVVTQMRPKWSIKGLWQPPERPELTDGRGHHRDILSFLRGLVSPADLLIECIQASVTHNQRVAMGAQIQHNRVFGGTGGNFLTANGVFTAVAMANAAFTETVTDKSIGSVTQSVTTNEFTTIGLSRAAGASQNASAAPGAMDGTQSSDVYKSFSVTGSGTAYGTALFDSTTVAGSNLYVEDVDMTDAVVVNGDTLNVTWTITF